MAVWCAVIFAGSSVQGSPNPDPTWADWGLRKSAHLFEYAILYLLARRAFSDGPRAFLFCVAYAVSDEWHQTFVPYRMGQARDVLIDALGAFLASRLGQRA